MSKTLNADRLTIGKTVWLGLLQILSWGGSFYLLAVLAAPIAQDTGWSREWVMGAASIGLLAAGLASPLCGRLISRYGGRPVLASSGALMAAGLWMMASAQSLPIFLCAWVLTGIGMAAGLYDALFATLGAIYGMKARPMITGVTLISGFCTTLIWPLLAIAVQTLGWRGTCWLYGVVLLLGVFPIYRLCLPKQPALARPANTHAAGTLSIAPRIYWVMTTLFSLSAMLMTAISVIVIVLLQARGHSLAAAIALSAIIGPASVACRLIDLLTRDKHPVWTMLISVATTAAGILILAFMPSLTAFGLVLYGAGNGLRAIVRSTLPLAIVPVKDYAVISSKMAAPVFFCQAITPLVCGYLLTLVGAQTTVTLLAIMSAVTVGLGMFLTRLIKISANKNADHC